MRKEWLTAQTLRKVKSDKAKNRFIDFSNRCYDDLLLGSFSEEMGAEAIVQSVGEWRQ